MRKKFLTSLYIFGSVVIYLVGAVSSLMYENGLALNVAWNWAMKGSSQVIGFMFLAAILSILYFSMLYYAFLDSQLLLLAGMTVLALASYFFCHYLYFAILGAVGAVALIAAIYLEKRPKSTMPVEIDEDAIQEEAENQEVEADNEDEESEQESSFQMSDGANLDELDERELAVKINALFDTPDTFEIDEAEEEIYLDENSEEDSEIIEDSVTIDDLTSEFEALEEEEKNKSEDLS